MNSSIPPQINPNQHASFRESFVKYTTRESDAEAVRFRVEGRGSNSGVKIINGEAVSESTLSPNEAETTCCSPSWRSWASSTTRSWWGAAQTSFKSVVKRLPTLSIDNDRKGPRWVVRIVSEYANKRGEIVDDVTELEFRSQQDAEMYMLKWNQQMQKKSLDFPYNVYIFTRNVGQATPMDDVLDDVRFNSSGPRSYRNVDDRNSRLRAT